MAEVSGLVARYRSLKERLKKLYAEYGIAAIITWFGLFFLVLAGFIVAMEIGMGPGPSRGSWVAAYVATEATKPIRIVITLALTPVVAQFGRRLRGVKAATVVDTQEVDAK
jgi:hypothetical protein